MIAAMHLVGWTLIHFVWQGSILALTTAMALRLCQRPAARYLVGCVGLATMLAAPIATVAVLMSPAATRATVMVSDNIVSSPPSSLDRGPVARVATTSTFAEKAIASPGGAADGSRLMAALVICWMAGVVVLFVRLAVGWWQVKRLYARAMSLPSSRWLAAGERIARLIGLARVPHIVDSALVDVPTVVGWFRPLVLLPIAALANLTPAQVDSILAHELAHIRRHDYLVNVLQTVAETLLFYHPAVWWVSGRVRAEREHCCDEIAVDTCGDAADYARALVELESWRVSTTTMALAATGGSLFDRVRRIMCAPATDAPRSSGWVVMIALIAILTAGAGAVDWLHATGERATTATAALNDQDGYGPSFVGRAHHWLLRMTHAHLRWLRVHYFGPVSDAHAATARDVSAALSVDRARRFSTSRGAVETAEAPDAPDSPDVPDPRDPPDPAEPAEAPERPATAEAPTPMAPPVPPAPQPPRTGRMRRARRVWSSSRDAVTWDTGFLCFGMTCAHGMQVNVRGTLALKQDLTDVESLSDGGYFTLRVWSLFIPRTVEIRAEHGTLTHRYFVGGLSRRYDDEARRLLANELPSLVRRSGLAAVPRVRQILESRGAPGVLDEIRRLESDYARGLYFRALFDASRLDPPTMARALALVGQIISSDFERSRTLRVVAPVAGADPDLAKAYVETADRISSDFEHQRALLALVLTERPAPAVRELVAQSASRLQSDFEKSRLLRSIIAWGPLDASEPVFTAIRGMRSDFEKSRVLRQLLASRDLPLTAKKGVLETVPSMSSGFEQSRVLRALLAEPLDPALRDAFLGAANHIGSSFEQSRVLVAYVRAERR